MKPFKNIHTFDEIEITSKCTLVLDFDETIAKYDNISKQWWKERFDFYYSIYADYDTADRMALEDWKKHIHIVNPSHTDKNGIFNLIKSATKYKCRTLCLTARSSILKEITIKHLEYLGIIIDEIHFSENMGKGHYLNGIINNEDDVIFVDDSETNILDVLKNVTIARSVSCYQFII